MQLRSWIPPELINSSMRGNRVYMRDNFLALMYIYSWTRQMNEWNIVDESFPSRSKRVCVHDVAVFDYSVTERFFG